MEKKPPISLWTIAAGVVLGIVLFLITGNVLYEMGFGKPEDPLAKGNAACERAYGAGTSAAANCQVRLAVELLDKREAARMDAVRQAAGQ